MRHHQINATLFYSYYLNGKIRKYTKNKLSFPNDEALKKSVYLCIAEIEKKWTQPVWNWG
ncbi:hypothetical protein EZS27_031686 [termite gut metagenome]|uniref:Uncharacterized protein n=1 Tax=termite gut metagenome TaxID=433724 RepID=A0A5J4QBF3_9ZZZZ